MQKELALYPLPVSRKKYKTDLHLKKIHLSNLEKKRMKQSELNNLTHFGDTSAIHSARDGAEVLDAIKRQKRKQKDFKKKGGGKRRRK